MIELYSVCKSFTHKGHKTNALSNISFTIEPEEILGIVGKSGAGKSTLLRLISLQMQPDSGEISFLGDRVNASTTSRKINDIILQTSFVFQGFSLLFNRNVLENTALPLTLRGVDQITREQKAMALLNFVGLADKADAYPVTLSGGEAQRVAIARALVSEPKVIFLDEPTSALDGETMKGILDLLKKTHSTYGVTMVLVSHQIDVVRYMCDRVLLLENGKVEKLEHIQNKKDFRVEKISDIWSREGV